MSNTERGSAELQGPIDHTLESNRPVVQQSDKFGDVELLFPATNERVMLSREVARALAEDLLRSTALECTSEEDTA